VRGFQRLQLAQQAVVLGIGDIRVVEHVVAEVGVFDAQTQAGDLRIRRGRVGHVHAPRAAASPRHHNLLAICAASILRLSCWRIIAAAAP